MLNEIRNIESLFLQNGKFSVVLPRREAFLLKKNIETDLKLRSTSRKVGWWYALFRVYLTVSGIITSLVLSLYSPRAATLFDFYVFNKQAIRNIDQDKNVDTVTFTFHRKTHPRVFRQNLDRHRKAAEHGDVNAQTYLGFIYLEGNNVPADLVKARNWFSKAAEHGDARAQTYLAYIYEKGKGVPVDYQKALKWYRKAANQDYAMAQYNLGVMYENGNGVAKSETTAVNWYYKAAERGDAVAQLTLGRMYANGRGVKKNEAQALTWIRRSAEQGNNEAQYALSLAYENGIYGCPRDAQKAKYWLERSRGE